MLVDGRDPLEVAQALNHIIGLTGHAWCDGGSYDAHWFKTLFRAAGIKPTFYLWDIAALFALDRPMRTRFYAMLAADDAPHRAGPDALRLCVALVRANGGQVGGGEGTTHQWRAM